MGEVVSSRVTSRPLARNSAGQSSCWLQKPQKLWHRVTFRPPKNPMAMPVSTPVCPDLAKLLELYRSALQDWTQARSDCADDSMEIALATRYVEQLEAALSHHRQEHGC